MFSPLFLVASRVCVGLRPGIRPGGRLTFFAGAKKVSKESTLSRHTWRCHRSLRSAPVACEGSQSLARQSVAMHPRQANPQLSNACQDPAQTGWFVFFGFVLVRRRTGLLRPSSRNSVEQGFASLRTPLARAQRKMTTPGMVCRVLSLPTLFAPAKKVGRPPGRTPGLSPKRSSEPPSTGKE